MKTFSDGKPVKRSAAMNCLLVNQLATPGLGSLMGRRLLAGVVQLSMAVAGFVLALGAFIQWMLALYQQFGSANAAPGPFPAYGKIGGILFIASWCLSWITSISIVREAEQQQKKDLLSPKPPKLDRG